MISLNLTLFIQIFNLLLLIISLNYLIFRPILRLVEERRRREVSLEKEVDDLEREVERRVSEYEGLINQAKAQGKLLKDGLKKEADFLSNQLIAQTRKDNNLFLKETKAGIGKEKEKVREALQGVAETISGEIITKLLGKAL